MCSVPTRCGSAPLASGPAVCSTFLTRRGVGTLRASSGPDQCRPVFRPQAEVSRSGPFLQDIDRPRLGELDQAQRRCSVPYKIVVETVRLLARRASTCCGAWSEIGSYFLQA